MTIDNGQLSTALVILRVVKRGRRIYALSFLHSRPSVRRYIDSLRSLRMTAFFGGAVWEIVNYRGAYREIATGTKCPRNDRGRKRVRQAGCRGERCDRRQWRRKGAERVAAVDKIEDQRKPEDFIGYRNRTSSPTRGVFWGAVMADTPGGVSLRYDTGDCHTGVRTGSQ